MSRYSDGFYSRFSRPGRMPAQTLYASLIMRAAVGVLRRSPASIVDVGCGYGQHDVAMRTCCPNAKITGIDHGPLPAAHWMLNGDKNARFIDVDLEADDLPDRIAVWPYGESELCLTTEVLEHIRPESADFVVDFINRITSRVIIMTAAAHPGGGRHHVNCQPPLYWRRKFQSRGKWAMARRHTWWLSNVFKVCGCKYVHETCQVLVRL